jgi:hypothetical protein
MLERFIVTSVHAGETEMLHAVARGAERNEPLQALDVVFVVVRPDLVTLDGMIRTLRSSPSSATDLAPVPCSAIDGAAHEVPFLLRQEATDVREPAR